MRFQLAKWRLKLTTQKQKNFVSLTPRALVFATVMLSVLGCQTTQSSGQQAGAALGRWAPAEQALAQAERFHQATEGSVQLVSMSDRRVLRAQKLTDQLTKHSFKPYMKVRVFVVDSQEINSFTAGANYIYLTAGLFDATQSQDELAFILAHEIAHIDLAHGAGVHFTAQKGSKPSEKLNASIQQFKGLLEQAKSLNQDEASPSLLSELDTAEEESDLVEHIGLALDITEGNYTRHKETQADVLGFRIAKSAGFEPENGVKFFERMAQREQGSNGGLTEKMGFALLNKLDELVDPKEGESVSQALNQKTPDLEEVMGDELKTQFTATHPMNNDRIQNLKRLAKYYETFEVGQPQPQSLVALFDGVSGDKTLALIDVIEEVDTARRVSLRGGKKLCGPKGLKIAQRALNQQGLKCGYPDGLWGENTKLCLMAYQKRHELPQSGQLDLKTCGKLKAEGVAFLK